MVRNEREGGVLDVRLRAEAGEPEDSLFRTEPGPLALGILTRAQFHFLQRLGFGIRGIFQEAKGLLIAERLKGLGKGTDAGGQQGTDFLEQTAPPHLLTTEVQAAVELFPRGIESQQEGAVTGKRLETSGLKQIMGGPPGKETEFEGANGFITVVGMDAFRGGGIQTGEQPADGSRAAGFAVVKGSPEGIVAVGGRRESAQESAEIEAGTATEDGEPGAGVDTREDGADFGGEIAGGEEIGGRTEVEQVVRNTLLFGYGELCGADIKAGIDLHGVKIDDFSVKPSGEGERESGFAGASGTGDGEDWQIRHQVFSGPFSV